MLKRAAPFLLTAAIAAACTLGSDAAPVIDFSSGTGEGGAGVTSTTTGGSGGSAAPDAGQGGAAAGSGGASGASVSSGGMGGANAGTAGSSGTAGKGGTSAGSAGSGGKSGAGGSSGGSGGSAAADAGARTCKGGFMGMCPAPYSVGGTLDDLCKAYCDCMGGPCKDYLPADCLNACRMQADKWDLCCRVNKCLTRPCDYMDQFVGDCKAAAGIQACLDH